MAHSRAKIDREALKAARGVSRVWQRAEALGEVGLHFQEPLRAQILSEALAAGREIEWEIVRAKVMAKLAIHLSEPLRDQILPEVWEVIPKIDDIDLLIGLSACSPQPLQEQVLRQALVKARETINSTSRVNALDVLVPNLMGLPCDVMYSMWSETLHFAAGRARKDFLLDLRVLFPMVVALNRPETVTETFRAIQDVGRWWP